MHCRNVINALSSAITTLKMGDAVALLEDLPHLQLYRGQVGLIAEVYSEESFEVEFVDTEGFTYGLTTLHASQVLPLVHDQITEKNPNE